MLVSAEFDRRKCILYEDVEVCPVEDDLLFHCVPVRDHTKLRFLHDNTSLINEIAPLGLEPKALGYGPNMLPLHHSAM